jgi:hypothetical protein
MTEPELKELMNTACLAVEQAASILAVERPHFVLVMFNDPGMAQYASNCERADVITALRATADRLQRKQDVARVPFAEG